MRRRWLAAAILSLAAVQATAQETSDDDVQPPLHVLFIGNSLTYTNDLPAMFAALAEAAGKPRPFVRAVTGPGLSLQDQWDLGEAQKAIAVGGWDFVVLQQGPSASPEGTVVSPNVSRAPRATARSPGTCAVVSGSRRT